MLLRELYADDNSKEVVMENDDTLSQFFGSPEVGRALLEDIEDDVWEQNRKK